MSVQLEIMDGLQWWLSPDIRIVPGNDPTGSPGIPTAGNQCYLWARVIITAILQLVTLPYPFYWANPHVGFDRTTAHPIGPLFVSLDPGESQDVLCLSP